MKSFIVGIFCCVLMIEGYSQIPAPFKGEPAPGITASHFRSEVQKELSRYPGGAELYRRSDVFERLIDRRVRKRLGILPHEASLDKPFGPLSDTTKVSDISLNTNDQDEASIAISRMNPKLIVAGANDEAMLEYSMPAYLSTDAGISWRTYRLPIVHDSDGTAYGDPVLIPDDSGNFYYCFLIIGEQSGLSDLIVAHSKNGKTWTLGSPVLGNPAGDNIEDKPTIAVDRDPASPYHGRLYIAWTRYENISSDWSASHFISYSDDHGMSWSNPEELVTDYGYFALLRTGHNGTVFYASSSIPDSGMGDHGMMVSHDGGSTFEEYPVAPFVSYPMNGNGDNGLKGYDGFRAFPYIAFDVDPSSNKLFAVYGTYDSDNYIAMQYAITSTNEGKTWSTPRQIGTPAMLLSDHFFPWVSFDPVEQKASIMLYSSEEDIDNRDSRAVRCAFDTTDRMELLGDDLFDPTSITASGWDFIGDYIGSDAWNGTFAAAWTENRPNATDGDIFAYIESPNTSSVRQINETAFEISEPSPNPVLGDRLAIVITGNAQQMITARLFDQRGVMVLCMASEINPDRPTDLQFDLTHLPAGIYRAVLSGGWLSVERNIVVLH